MFFFAFHAISNIKEKNGVKKIGVKKNSGGGGGGVEFKKKIFLVSHFMLFSKHKKKILKKKCPFTYWLNGRWFLQIQYMSQ